MSDFKKLKRQHENGRDEDDKMYFNGYNFLQCHQTMLSDLRRTNAFRFSILKSYEHLFKKTVLEIGCGTGILSIFACQAGASHVYAIDASDIIQYAKRVVDKNGYTDRIDLVQAKVEDYYLPSPDAKVDAIISEWMGYTLFTEWMLPSVIAGRDRFLKEGGLLFPSKVSMFIALVTETSFLKERAEYWRTGPVQDYKIDMTVLAEEEYTSAIGKMAVHDIEPTEIISDVCVLLNIDLHQILLEETKEFKAMFSLMALGRSESYGYCLWFKATFPEGVELDTSPFCESTHWQQTIVYVPPFAVEQGDKVSGSISFTRHPKCSRQLAIDLKYKPDGDDGKMNEILFLDVMD